MSELARAGDDDFDQLAALLAADPAFAESMMEANAAHDYADAAGYPEVDRAMLSTEARYDAEPIDDVVAEIHDTFLASCEHVGINPSTAAASHGGWQFVNDEVARVTHATERMRAGDVLSAQGAVIVDFAIDGKSNKVSDPLQLPPDYTVLGQLVAPVIGRMPDDMLVFSGIKDGIAPYGVGLILQNPMLIDDEGETVRGEIEAGAIVLVLGTMGLRVDKIHYDQTMFHEVDEL